MFKVLNRNLRYLFIINLAFGFSIQLITPLFPLFLSELGANATENATVISIGGLISTLLMLPSGLLVDKLGRKTLLISSAAVNLVSIYLMSYTQTWIQVIPLFALYSASWALFIPARMSMITANSEIEIRSSVFGVMNTSWPIAGVLSPYVSGKLIETIGWKQVFIVGAAVNILGVIAGLGIKRREKRVSDSSGGLREIMRGKYIKILSAFFVYGTFISIGLAGVMQIMPLYLDEYFELSASQIGLFFTVQSIITLLTQIPSGAVADRYGRKRTLIALLIPIPLLISSWYFIDNWWILLGLNSLAFGLWSMTWPSLLTLLSNAVPSHLVGATFGLNTTGNRFGQTLGPIIASYFYVNYFQTSPFLVSSVLCLSALLFALRIKETD